MKFFRLPNAIILEVQGPHASRYLQARLTNDMRMLSSTRALVAAALTPQGKTEGVFTVLFERENHFLLVADGGSAVEVIQGLKRFLVTERVEVIDRSAELCILHYFDLQRDVDLSLGTLPSSDEGSPLLDVKKLGAAHLVRKKRGESSGWDLLLPLGLQRQVLSELSQYSALELDPGAITLFRLRGGVPQFPDEMNSEHLFVSAGLPDAISYTKGCYTGQEVVAKIDAMGKAPRVLRLLSVAGGAPMPKAEIIEARQGKVVGTVLTCTFDSARNCTLCFADLRNVDGLSELQLSVAGVAAHLEIA